MDLKEAGAGFSRRHPWELSRIKALQRIVGFLGQTDIRSVLDIGCGDGYTASKLLENHTVDRLVGVDSHFQNRPLDEVAHTHPQAVFFKELGEVPGPAFDMLLLLDVVEHIADDRVFLHTVVGERLSDSGHVLITAPAFPMLFSDHDRFLQHQRRYTRESFRSLIGDSDLDIVKEGYLFASLLWVRFFSTGLERLLPGYRKPATGIGGWSYGAWTTKAIELVLRLDNYVLLALGNTRFAPAGLSIWALCRKRPS